MEFDGKVAIVTGATSGIGMATALQFAAEGAKVAAVGRRNEGLAKLDRPNIRTYQVDLTRDDERVRLIVYVVRDFGGIDILVNAAGIIAMGTIENTTLADFDTMFNVNVRSIFHLTQLALPSIIERKGNIVNVSSVNGLRAFAGLIAYNSSKAALDHMTRCAALELAPKGIRVNAVNPGVTRTGLHKTMGMADDAYAAFVERSKTTHPIGRIGEPEEIASLICYLASSKAGWITGVTYSIDGGRAQTCLR